MRGRCLFGMLLFNNSGNIRSMQQGQTFCWSQFHVHSFHWSNVCFGWFPFSGWWKLQPCSFNTFCVIVFIIRSPSNTTSNAVWSSCPAEKIPWQQEIDFYWKALFCPKKMKTAMSTLASFHLTKWVIEIAIMDPRRWTPKCPSILVSRTCFLEHRLYKYDIHVL